MIDGKILAPSRAWRGRRTLARAAMLLVAGPALAELDESLTELGTDHVDIWYLHAKSTAEDVSDDLRLLAVQVSDRMIEVREIDSGTVLEKLEELRLREPDVQRS